MRRVFGAIVVALVIVTPAPALALGDAKASSRPALLVAAGFTGTPWFYALSAVSLVGAIAAAYRLRLLRAQARERELIRLVEERTSQLQQANDHLQRLSYIDALTNIANRRHFQEILEIEWRRAFRARAPMTLLMLDIDYFKPYNDAFGHREGDRCLARVATALDESVQRAGDLLARYGGEEFAAILTNTDEPGGAEVAERLRATVEQLGIKRSDDSTEVVTISVGVATGIPGEVSSHEVLLAAADKALYQAKRAGRNRVGVAPARISGDRIIPPAEPDAAI